MGGTTGGLAVLGIAASAVALYYYLVVLKNALVVKAIAPAAAAPIRVHGSTSLVLILINLALILLGVGPSLILSRL